MNVFENQILCEIQTALPRTGVSESDAANLHKHGVLAALKSFQFDWLLIKPMKYAVRTPDQMIKLENLKQNNTRNVVGNKSSKPGL